MREEASLTGATRKTRRFPRQGKGRKNPPKRRIAGGDKKEQRRSCLARQGRGGSPHRSRRPLRGIAEKTRGYCERRDGGIGRKLWRPRGSRCMGNQFGQGTSQGAKRRLGGRSGLGAPETGEAGPKNKKTPPKGWRGGPRREERSPSLKNS